MKYLKIIWPIVLFLVIICICVSEWNTNASMDAGGVIVFFIIAFFVFLPIGAFISCVWYGYVLKGTYKWIFLPVGLIPGVILMLLCSDGFSLELLMFEIPSVAGAFLGQLLGNVIWKVRQKRCAVRD